MLRRESPKNPVAAVFPFVTEDEMIEETMRLSRITLLLFTFGAACATARAGGVKPPESACREASHGTYWPTAANSDPQLLQAKAAEGELWVCHGNYDADLYFPTLVHLFKWERVTVRYARAGTESSAARHAFIAPPNSDVRP